MSEPRRLILLSGMGADHRLMQPIAIDGVEVVTPDHIDPLPGETLADYASRVADAQGVRPSDVIGGSSFGGMLAAQIASTRKVAGLVLLGTCINRKKLPRSHAWFERISRVIPDALMGVRYWRWQLRWRLGPLTPDAEACVWEMTRDFSIPNLRAFGRMIIEWDGADRFDCPVLSVHGGRDRILPLRCAEPGVEFDDAGHAFTLTHTVQTTEAIASFIATSVAGGSLPSATEDRTAPAPPL